jgi:hypothetical protein
MLILFIYSFIKCDYIYNLEIPLSVTKYFDKLLRLNFIFFVTHHIETKKIMPFLGMSNFFLKFIGYH